MHILLLALALTCPMHAHDVDARHNTLVPAQTHHAFRLFTDGGAIELRADDANDQPTIDAVRAHLRDIAAQFAKNDFRTPAFVHGHAPDAVAAMQRLHDAIAFRFEPLDRGARIRITTSNAEALAALHEFLRFQIDEHRTGDSGKVEPDK
jgi:hypothetical protein